MSPSDVTFRLRAVPAAVFVDLLREAAAPLDARALKHRLEAQGVERSVVVAAWKRAQPGVRRHANIVFDAGRGVYRWSDNRAAVPALTAEDALDRLLPARLSARKAELAEIVRAALKERDGLEARVRGAYQGAREARAAQERQITIDAVRALAEVAMEVEELAAAGADNGVTVGVTVGVIVERVRALAAESGLVPIGRAGEQTVFDPRAHTPIGGLPAAGSRVSIIRPGYTWRAGDRDVLIGKAHVAAVLSPPA